MGDPIIEQVGGDEGATVKFMLHENSLSVSFFAANIECLGAMPGESFKPNYMQKGAQGFPCDNAESFDTAERYVEGFVKWDGCSHVSFGADEDYQLHLCGRSDFNKLTSILVAIYERCGEIMSAAGTELLAGEFESR